MDFYAERMEYLRRKFNLPDSKLALTENPLPQNEGRPLDKVVEDFNRELGKGTKLKVVKASTGYKTSEGKTLTKLWFDVRY